MAKKVVKPKKKVAKKKVAKKAPAGKAKGLQKQADGEIATKSKAAEKSQGKGTGVAAKKEAAKVVKLVPKDQQPRVRAEEVGEALARQDKRRLCIAAAIVAVVVAAVLLIVLL